MTQTAMQQAMAKALRAKEAAVPKANPVNPTKGYQAMRNSQEGTGKRTHDGKKGAC